MTEKTLSEKIISNPDMDVLFRDDVADAVRRLKEGLLNPNTKSKNFIEISDFNYWINSIFGSELAGVKE